MVIMVICMYGTLVQLINILQVADHEQHVVKPKEEARLKKKENDFYKFSGPAWKGAFEKVGVSFLNGLYIINILYFSLSSCVGLSMHPGTFPCRPFSHASNFPIA